MRCFWQKIGKKSQLEKLEIMMKKECSLSKNASIFKILLDENGKAKNLPVTAGRLVEKCFETKEIQKVVGKKKAI